MAWDHLRLFDRGYTLKKPSSIRMPRGYYGKDHSLALDAIQHRQFYAPNMANPAKRMRVVPTGQSLAKIEKRLAAKAAKKAGDVLTETKTKKRQSSNSTFTMPGVYRGSFKRGRRVKKQVWPCVFKDETSAGISGPKCVYAYHGTHPNRVVMRMLGKAMIHYYFTSCGIKIKNWLDVAGVPQSIGTTRSCTITIRAVSHNSLDATDPTFTTLLEQNGATTSVTYQGLADALSDGLVAMVSTASTALMITEVQFMGSLSSSGSTHVSLPFRSFSGNEIFISVTGKSIVNIQNRTEGGAAADHPAEDLTTSIYSNPIKGKTYTFNGGMIRFRDIGLAITGTSRQMAPDVLTGFGTVSSTATDFAPAAINALEQPPRGNYFLNCTSSQYVRLDPGQIKKHTIYSIVTKSLQGWLRALLPAIQSASGVNSIGNGNKTLGVAGLIAFEKVCDVGSGKNVALGCERDGVYKAKMFIKRKHITTALNG